MKAEVLTHDGKATDAREALRSALEAAQQIPNPASRKRSTSRISQTLAAMKETQNAAKETAPKP